MEEAVRGLEDKNSESNSERVDMDSNLESQNVQLGAEVERARLAHSISEVGGALEVDNSKVKNLPSRLFEAFTEFNIPELITLIISLFKHKTSLNPQNIEQKIEPVISSIPEEKKGGAAMALAESQKPDESHIYERFVASHLQSRMSDDMWDKGFREGVISSSDSRDIDSDTSLESHLLSTFPDIQSKDQAIERIRMMQLMGIPLPPDGFKGRLYFGKHGAQTFLVGFSSDDPPPTQLQARAFLPSQSEKMTPTERFQARLTPGDLVLTFTEGGDSQVNFQEGFSATHIAAWDGNSFLHAANEDGWYGLFNSRKESGVVLKDSFESFITRSGSGTSSYFMILKNPLESALIPDFISHLYTEVGNKYSDKLLAKKAFEELRGTVDESIENSKGDICTSLVQNALMKSGNIRVSESYAPNLIDYFKSCKIQWQGRVKKS